MATIRKPAFAGSFYPATKAKLKKLITDLIRQAGPAPPLESSQVKAVLVPHAGWIYSGLTAVAAYQILAKKRNHQFILLGPSHTEVFKGVTQDNHQSWQTPLGLSPVELLPEDSWLTNNPRPHLPEHSLEVQLPFLQFFVKDLTITPLLTSLETDYQKLAQNLQPHLTPKTIFVVSSDLSHYLPESLARKIDQETIKQILALHLQELGKDRYQACGKTGVLTLTALAKKLSWQPKLLHYRTSATTSGDSRQVVGYASLAFLKKKAVSATRFT